MQESSGNLICGYCGSEMIPHTSDAVYGISYLCPQGKENEGNHGISYGDLPYPAICNSCFSPLILVRNIHENWFTTICSNPDCPDYEYKVFEKYKELIYQKRVNIQCFLSYGSYLGIFIKWLSINQFIDEDTYLFNFICRTIKSYNQK